MLFESVVRVGETKLFSPRALSIGDNSLSIASARISFTEISFLLVGIPQKRALKPVDEIISLPLLSTVSSLKE